MADKEGRGSGAGLFVVGLLIGVAGTLISAKPKLVMHQGGLSGAKPSSAAAAVVNDQSPSDVADDAAAAGMTSRTPPTNTAQ